MGRGTGAFISALSADETSPALAAPRHAITALFSCRFKCPCPPRRQRHFRSNADRAYNTLHFASKVVCQGASPFGNPGQQNRRYAALSGSIPPFVVSSPFHGLRVVPSLLLSNLQRQKQVLSFSHLFPAKHFAPIGTSRRGMNRIEYTTNRLSSDISPKRI